MSIMPTFRVEVMCSKLHIQRELKADGFLAVKLRKDVWYTIKQQHTEEIHYLRALCEQGRTFVAKTMLGTATSLAHRWITHQT